MSMKCNGVDNCRDGARSDEQDCCKGLIFVEATLTQ